MPQPFAAGFQDHGLGPILGVSGNTGAGGANVWTHDLLRDLWPGEDWNFVFGQASLRERVGVWSIYRNGDPDESDAAFRLCLRRTLKTATHETGHMFSMMHCTLYECNMCGSNHRAESDRRPLALCPHCLAKLCHATGAKPAERFERLITFCEANGLKPEREFYAKSLQALK